MSLSINDHLSYSKIEESYHQKWLPELKKSGKPFIKLSRQKHPELESSIIVTAFAVFGQYHGHDKTGMLTDTRKHWISAGGYKELVGIGSYKDVWDLKLLYPVDYPIPPTVRSRFRHSNLNQLEELQKIELLKNELSSPFLHIPASINYKSYRRSNTTNPRALDVTIVQISQKALGGDLSDCIYKPELLSYLGKLRALYHLALIMTKIHKIKWVHRDIKPSNVFLMNKDPDCPIIKLADFDFAKDYKQKQCEVDKEFSNYCKGTARYMDPKYFQDGVCGFDNARIHDQFSFGATCYELVTRYLFRKGLNDANLEIDVEEKDLKFSNCKSLSDEIKNMIRDCCLGSFKERPYRLPEFVDALKKLAEEEFLNRYFN